MHVSLPVLVSTWSRRQIFMIFFQRRYILLNHLHRLWIRVGRFLHRVSINSYSQILTADYYEHLRTTPFCPLTDEVLGGEHWSPLDSDTPVTFLFTLSSLDVFIPNNLLKSIIDHVIIQTCIIQCHTIITTLWHVNCRATMNTTAQNLWRVSLSYSWFAS